MRSILRKAKRPDQGAAASRRTPAVAAVLGLALLASNTTGQQVITPPRAAPDGPVAIVGASSGAKGGVTVPARPSFSPMCFEAQERARRRLLIRVRGSSQSA